MEKLFQVNIVRSLREGERYTITRHSANGHVGITIGMAYQDGYDCTDWCLFIGTWEECQEYIRQCD